jgi:GT2 family glycosyltransferase
VLTSRAKIAVVVVNWNGWRDTLAAYESLKHSTHQNWEAIVIENGSTDESLAKLRGDRDRFLLMESRANLGFAGACNLGVAEARTRGADYIYLLNNDAVVMPDTLERLLSTSMSLEDQAVLGSVIRREPSGSLQFWGSTRNERWGGPEMFAGSEEEFSRAPSLIDSDFVVGASLFAPVAVFARVGTLDDRFFLLFEEADWCYRARDLGYRCAVIKDVEIRHQDGASIGSMASPMRMYFVKRNRLLFCEKNCSRGLFVLVLARQIVGSLLRAMIHRGNNSLAMQSRVNLLATWHYVIRRFGDCPPIIRQMTAELRASPGQA